jgi:multicomponent Na+:H+ antiporter subunit F
MHIAMVIAMAGVLLAALRMIIGPTAVDRTLSLDTLTVISISLIAMGALFMGRSIYLDVAMVYAILSFIEVVAVARYIEGGL